MAADHRHHISGSTLAAGREAVKEMARSMHAAFPDLAFVIEDVLVDGDQVLVRWTAHGTHAATFGGVEAGPGPGPASGGTDGPRPHGMISIGGD
jgi:predicted ester cyclase